MSKRLLLAVLLISLSGYTVFSQNAQPSQDSFDIEVLVPEVIATMPHRTEDFTQGLVWDEGRLFQSTGLYGQSHLQELDPETGEPIRETPLPEQFFGEGLALVGDQLIQITWQQQVAIYYDIATFEPEAFARYTGEGWGLCYDGEALYMTDGSSILYQRDPETFQAMASHEVTLMGVPIVRLNELECVEDVVYANVWQTDRIVRIDKATGEVTAVIDASNLLTLEERAVLPSGAVLNGIAYNAETGTFLVTGKLWPTLFEVNWVPLEG
jgi:glutamine cyclotransferase